MCAIAQTALPGDVALRRQPPKRSAFHLRTPVPKGLSVCEALGINTNAGATLHRSVFTSDCAYPAALDTSRFSHSMER